MAKSESNVEFQSDETGWMGLSSHAEEWKRDKVNADQLGLNWAAIQGKFYEGERSVKYVTKDSIIACNCGTFFSRIDMPVDHGVETKETHLPILTVDDFGSQNIPSFGDCSLKTGEDSITCIPRITQSWTQEQVTASADNASLLKADAFAVCNVGGTISVKEVNTTPRESLMAVLKEQYGFDERTTKIILQIYQAIQDKYKNESQINRDWRFTRLLGGMEYGLKGEGRTDEFKWNETAGDATIVELQSSEDSYDSYSVKVDLSEKNYLMSELGIIESDYEYLKYKVRIQNFMAGYDANYLKKNYQSKYLTPMSKGVGETLGEDEAKKIWEQQCDDMCGMTDFAHQHITMATILATAVSQDGIAANVYTGGQRRREQMAGWLGDATLSEKGKPTFGNDDYKADLDAENISFMIKSEEYSYIKAVEDYYERQLLEDNRAVIFLRNNSIKDIKELIYNELILPERTDKVSSTRGTEQSKEYEDYYDINNESIWLDKLLKEKSPGGYNFIRSLKDKLPDIGDYR